MRQGRLSRFLLGIMADGKRYSLDTLKREAAATDILNDSASPGRSINFTLVGLQRHGYVARDKDGRWYRLPDDDAPSAEADGAS